MTTTQQRRARLSIDVPREARRRVHIAAAKRDQSIRDYVWEAVEARLKHDLADELSAADLVALNERADPVLAALGTTQRTPPMTSVSRGDVVLVRFVFADEKGVKQRPGLIVSTDRYHEDRRETILAAITSNVGRLLIGDYKIRAWRESGLPYHSIVTGIVRTIKHDMIAAKMGELPASELRSVENKLREILAL